MLILVMIGGRIIEGRINQSVGLMVTFLGSIAILVSLVICANCVPMRSVTTITTIDDIDIVKDSDGQNVYILHMSDDMVAMKEESFSKVTAGDATEILEYQQYCDYAWQYWFAFPCQSGKVLRLGIAEKSNEY